MSVLVLGWLFIDMAGAAELQKKCKFLKSLCKLSKKDRLKYLKECQDNHILTISEAIANVLLHVCPPTKPSSKKKVAALNKHMKKLTSKKATASVRRKIISHPQIGEGLISIIASTVLPFLASLLSKSKGWEPFILIPCLTRTCIQKIQELVSKAA